MEKELIKIIKLLNKHKIKYMLIGGYAVILYGVQRSTFDIDIAILLKHEEIKKVINLLSKYGFVPVESNIEPSYGIRLLSRDTQLDLMFIENPRFDILYRYHEEYHYKNTLIKMPNIMDLVSIKETSGRPKDIEDAITLRNIASIKSVRRRHA